MGEGDEVVYGLLANAEVRPDHPALVCGERRLNYRAFAQLVARVARVLHDHGLRPGERVALLLGNDVEFLAVTHAAATLGAAAVPLNPRWRHDEVAYVLQDAAPVALVLDDAHASEVEAACRAAGGPERSRRLVVGGEVPGWPAFATAVAAAPEGLPPGAVRESGFALLVYTSGTTGRPKGVIHPSFDPQQGFEAQRRLAELWGFGPADVHLVAGPLYHTMPAAYATQHLFVGATVVVMRRFDAEDCLRLVATERVTTTAMVPAHFVRILELDPAIRGAYDLRSLRKVLHAAAPCPIEVKRRIMELFGADVVWEFYGATEGPGTLISPEEWRRKPGSVGRPWPGVRLKILDDEGREVPTGQVGTIWLSAPGGAGFRYHRDPDKTARAWREGFFTVGDLGWVDADGYLYIADRRTDLVISGGVNIYPAEVEGVLITHPDIADCAVIGVPDARWGQALLAVVEPRPGAGLELPALQSWCRERLAAYKTPRHLVLVEALPRDPNGKVRKALLRERYADQGTSR